MVTTLFAVNALVLGIAGITWSTADVLNRVVKLVLLFLMLANLLYVLQVSGYIIKI